MIRGAVNLIPEAPVSRIVDLARLAERLGYARCWVYDEGLAARDVYVTLTAIAVATDTIQLGPGITNPYTRHMTSTAGAIAALDELSDGRAFLGVGAGGSMTLDPIGIKRHRPLAAVRDLITSSRALLSGQRVDFAGESVEIHGAHLEYARPGTEIWLAGRGPRMLALGAQQCDGVMLDFIYKPHLAAKIDHIRSAASQVDRRPKISYSTMLVTNERSMTIARRHMSYRLIDSPPDVRAAIGLTEADAAGLRTALSAGLEAAGKLVRDEWVLPFVITGSVDSCRAELSSLAAQHDFDEFLVPVLDETTADETIETAAEVLGCES